MKRILSACGKPSRQNIKPRQLVNWLKWIPPNDDWIRYLVNSLKIPSPPNSQHRQLVNWLKWLPPNDNWFRYLVNSLKRPSPPNSKPLQVVKRILSACGKLSPQSIKPRQLVNWLKWLPPIIIGSVISSTR